MKTMIGLLLLSVSFISSCSKGGNDAPEPPDPQTPQRDIQAIDNAVSQFMSSYQIPRVSIAITRQGKLVYVKSYGKMSATDNTPVTNNSLYRIASLSKPITGVGVMKLLEANKLTLDSKVFGTGGILGNDYPTTQMANLADITVRHLLHHTVGVWGNDGNDPMFKQPTYSHSQLISWALDTYPATTGRGSYRYSNFGYCLLGRVIEKLSGKSYEQFIKDEVLTPCGIQNMSMSGNTLADRKPNEVLYTAQGGNPYNMNISRMDSHGGWLASATDLARFLVRVDGFSTKPDILKASTVATMTTRSVPSSNYACGWGVNDANHWWHLGSLPGTATSMVRANSGFNWVILCNSGQSNNNFTTAIDGLLWPAVLSNSTPWQDIDQF